MISSTHPEDNDSEMILPQAVLFDMDGTLTEPMLDFPKIKAEMGIGNRPILEALSEMSPAQRAVAEGILSRHEKQAAEFSVLNPGCRELLAWLDARGVSTALITRNSPLSTATVVKRHGLKIPVLITRDDAPPKPHPRPLALACDRLGVQITEAWMVGDGQYDIEAGHEARARTVWLSHRRPRPFAARPWREVADLWELADLLQQCGKDQR
jgi:HAD superfamily hydrolase (TIGR01509 family)